MLRDPVSIRIVGRTIYQEGLIIPLGNVAAIGIDGTVDFDQKLNLLASFAMAPPRKEIPVLSEILENTQLQVPITGTLKNPRIDSDAIAERFKKMGVNLLDTVIGAGVNGLGRILEGGPGAGRSGRPRDFFPPFVVPGREEAPAPAPPKPGGREPGEARAPADGPDAGVPPPPPPRNADPDDALDRSPSPSRPGQLTPQERQALREERKERRLEKRGRKEAPPRPASSVNARGVPRLTRRAFDLVEPPLSTSSEALNRNRSHWEKKASGLS